MALHRLQLVGQQTERDQQGGRDRSYLNCFAEVMDGGPDEPHRYVTKRAGLAPPPAVVVQVPVVGEGRGVASFNGNFYAVVGNTLYENGVALGVLATATGRVYFDSQQGIETLIISDGVNLYTVTAIGSIFTQLADPDIPSPHVPGVVVLDGYTFLMGPTAQINNSDLLDVTTWNAANFLTAELLPDSGVAIRRHLNYILALGSESTEVFYDAANTVGSPLQRFEGTPSLVGCAAGNSAVNIENTVAWIAVAQGGGKFVVAMEGLTPRPISTKAVEDSLDAEDEAIVNAYAYHVRVQGHSFYVLNLASQGVTWAYDFVENSWCRWSSVTGAVETLFSVVHAEEFNNRLIVQDLFTGQLSEMREGVYQDNGEIIRLIGTTHRFDSGTNANKFLHRLEVVGDNAEQTPGTLDISWSDDDYRTFNVPRALNLNPPASQAPALTRLGRFERRAFRYQFEGNAPLRLRHFELYYIHGTYGS